MSDINVENGLKLINIKTENHETGPVESWAVLKAKLGDSAKYTVLYFDYGIKFGIQNGEDIILSDGTVKFEQLQFDYLQLARFFDQNMELKIWRNGERKHYFRLYQVSEKDDETTEAVEAEQILWGTTAARNPKSFGTFTLNGDAQDFYWHTLTEDRGTQLVIPLPVENLELDPQKNPKKRVAVKTYNYIDYLDNGLATYVDCRFVDIKIKGDQNAN